MSVPEPPDYIANDELAVVACRNAYPSLVARGVWDDIFIATLGVLASIAARPLPRANRSCGSGGRSG
jgi:hypothetical protein